LKEIVILGGPNGAGKTTAARVLLPRKVRLNAYINADEIAAQDIAAQSGCCGLAGWPSHAQANREADRIGVEFCLRDDLCGPVPNQVIAGLQAGWMADFSHLSLGAFA
jgi:cytidylate kinase